MTALSDEKLIQMTAEGDQAAFRTLYERYHVSIYNYVLRLVHQPSTAEDLLQEIFVVIWQGARKFRGKSSPKTWMYRIAHYRSVSWLRENQKIESVPQQWERLSLQSQAASPEEHAIQSCQNDQIQSALEQLKPKHRAVVELTFVHGFAYKEIAQIMGCPVGTVKSRMSYALRYLAVELKNDGKID